MTPTTPKQVVDAYYQAGIHHDLPSFAPLMAEEFSVSAPDYLPWGGTKVGSFFRDEVLHHLPGTLDFDRFRYLSLTAEGSHVVAAIDIGVTGTADSVRISEHWEVVDGLARSIWVAYFEPQVLLRRLGITMPAS